MHLPAAKPSPGGEQREGDTQHNDVQLEKQSSSSTETVEDKDGKVVERDEFVPDPKFEKKLLRKLDRHLMPIISIMFMLSFL